MGPTILIFFVLTLASGHKEYSKPDEEDVVVDMITRGLISDPAADDHTMQAADPLKISASIRRMVEEAIENIPDPMKIDDHNTYIYLGCGNTASVSSHGVYITGQSGIITDTLRINLLIPVFPRITYKFTLPKLVIDIDSLYIALNINGIMINCHIWGQIFILDSSVQGTATVNAITQKVTSLTTIIHFGPFHSTLVGNMNGINITSALSAIITDIIPQFLNKYSHEINELVASFVLGLF